MPHPLVLQLRFTRSEFKRGLDGLTDADARQRLMPMNSISWNIGHMAWQEQRYWLEKMQQKVLWPELNEKFCFGCPGFAPPLDEMLTRWQAVTEAADPFLDTLTTADLVREFVYDDSSFMAMAGNLMQRVIYHYWYHNGENQAIRQMLGHTNLPDFVGNIDDDAPYMAH